MSSLFFNYLDLFTFVIFSMVISSSFQQVFEYSFPSQLIVILLKKRYNLVNDIEWDCHANFNPKDALRWYTAGICINL